MRKRTYIPLLVLALASVGLWCVPGVERLTDDTGRTVRARVIAVDTSSVTRLGLLDYGSERLEVEVLDGAFAGRRFAANNELRAQLELDKRFAPGDIATVVEPRAESAAGDVLVAKDHWRLGWGAVLFGGFCLILIAFGGGTGLKALFSFVFSCLVVWKAVIPLCLRGWPAVWTVFAAVALLTAVIMYLVAGATRKGLAAFLGASLGVFAGLALAQLFTALMKINGASLPYVLTLLNGGYERLDLGDLFVGSIVLASSGAVMDLAMDIAAGQEEVVRHNPRLPRRRVFRSGWRIGRSVVGTMTTTLLLAYSGGYLTLLMVFAAQGTPPLVFLNSTLVSAEAVKTLVGSFALVLVAPFTALMGALIISGKPARTD